MKKLIATLQKHCRRQLGVTIDRDNENEYKLLNGFLDAFARFYPEESPPVLMLRCKDSVRKPLQKTAKSVKISKRMHWETKGWAWTDVALDSSLPEATLLQLIDDSYQLCCDELKDYQKERLALLARNLKPDELVAELLKAQGLSRRQKEIADLAQPALLLKTKKATESKLALGQSKLGGQPDLPKGVAWPTFGDGKPLAFLAQINLSAAAAAGKLSGLPKQGLLSFFSVFGWQSKDDADPQLPPGKYDPSWTCVLYHPSTEKMQRQPTPKGLAAFKAATIEFMPLPCYPTDTKEPAVAKLGWKRDIKEKYDDFVMAFNGALGHQLGNPERNLLLGYADYEQEFVNQVAADDLQLLFQLASDPNAGMCWGDGGYVYFWISARDLARKKFDRVLTDYQCG